MHILMVSKACVVGAYQTKLEEIAAFADIELTVIVPPVWRDPAGPAPLERDHVNGYRLLVDPLRFNGSFHFHYYPRLKQRIRQLRPDILHMDEEPYNLATWLAIRQARAAGVKSLAFSWQNLNRVYPFPFNWMEKQVLSMIDYLIVGNQASAEVWRAKGYAGPYRVIPQFGVSPHLFRPAARKSDGERLRIGLAGRLVPEKGADLLLQAVAPLSSDWRVQIAGDGPERPRLEELARELGVAGRVRFDGPIPSSQMAAYLQQLDILVLPSRTLPNWKEQFGRILVEAMACGVVVVGSDSGEIPHVIGPAGLIFPEGDATALRQRLATLLESPERRRQLGQAGRERVLAHYTQAQIAAQTVEVYREIISYG